MATPFPSLTETWHTASYPAISPSRPELSAANKTVVITGGGTGIGAGIARAFAAAGSTKIALLGRRVDTLQETAQTLKSTFPALQVLTISADVTKKSEVDAAFDSVSQSFGGKVDVLVSNAGYINTASALHDVDTEDAWWAFEVHVRGTIHVAQAFRRVASDKGAVVVDMSSIVAILPAFPQAGPYTASKLAATKLWAYFGVENPGIRVVSIQPGRIETDMTKKIGVTGLDHVDLPAHFSVWLASPEAHFLGGKFVCANWDVPQLIARKEEFEKTELGTLTFSGFPPATL